MPLQANKRASGVAAPGGEAHAGTTASRSSNANAISTGGKTVSSRGGMQGKTAKHLCGTPASGGGKGVCQAFVMSASMRCTKHTCTMPGCTNPKGSKAAHCNDHVGGGGMATPGPNRPTDVPTPGAPGSNADYAPKPKGRGARISSATPPNDALPSTSICPKATSKA